MAQVWLRSLASWTTVARRTAATQSSGSIRGLCGSVLSTAPNHNRTTTSSASLFWTTTRPFSSYFAQKKQAKERRRELFKLKVERKERLKTRQDNRPRRGESNREFRAFFIKKKVHEEYMARKARQAGLDWKIDVAVILERQLVVMPDRETWEVEMENLQAHLGQFGKIYPKELFNVDFANPGDLAMTHEELLALLPEGFKPAPRETEADATGDVRTTDRKLKTSVYLTVQDGNEWMLPTVPLQADETLLAAGKRALADKIGPEVEFWCPSNCPFAVDMVDLPPHERTSSGFYGTKTFFMKFVHDEGQVSSKSMKVKDYAWLDRGEITEKMKSEYGNDVAKFYHYLM